MTDLLNLLLIFVLVSAVILFKKPLYAAILAGAAAAVLLYRIEPARALSIAAGACVSSDTITLVLSFYSITILQRMLEKRGHLHLAERSLGGIFRSRRINAMVAPFIIGLLPSPGAVNIAAPIVDNAAGDALDTEEKTFVTSYYRHISEAFLPTYASVILALQLSGVDMSAFVLLMLPMVAVLFFLGYVIYVRKIPKEVGSPPSGDKKKDILNLARSLWTMALAIAVILVCRCEVYMAVAPVIVLSFFFNRFSLREAAPMLVTAFEINLIVSTVAIMVFRDILTYTGVITALPALFGALPVPPAAIFSLVFFISPLIAGSQTTIALCMPLAFAAIPDGGLWLMVLLMSIIYIAMQISPAHICLAIVVKTFNTTFLALVRKTMPVLLWFILIAAGYSRILYSLRM